MTQPQRSNWTGPRVLALVVAAIVGLIGIVVALAGLAAIGLQSFASDDDGYLNSGTERLATRTFAITAEDIDLGTDPAGWAPQELLGTVRISAEGERPVFLGIGPELQVQRYLAGVGHAELTDFGFDEPRYALSRGGPPRRPPGDQRFWVASSEGPGRQQVEWGVEAGTWSVLVMNVDGARGVAIDAEAAVKLEWLIWAGVIALVLGLALLVVPIVVALYLSKQASRPPTEPPPQPPPEPSP